MSAGWWLERIVHHLREVRNEKTDEVLRSEPGTSEQVQAADQARADFGRWHFYSLLANITPLALVTAGMALAAHLPRDGEGP